MDYPSKISSVIFTHGCNLHCRYCHNPELVIGNRGDDLYKEFLEFLNGKDIEGVVISGGEPLTSPYLMDFIAKIKGFKLDIKLDTNGSTPAKLRKALASGMVDYVALDLKAFSDEDYKWVTRSECVLNNFYGCLDVIDEFDVDHEIRHTAWKIPKLEDIERLTHKLKGRKLFLQRATSENRTLDKRFRADSNLDLSEIKEAMTRLGINTISIRD